MPKTERELRVERLSRGRLRAVKGQISPEVDGVWLECKEGNCGGLERWMEEWMTERFAECMATGCRHDDENRRELADQYWERAKEALKIRDAIARIFQEAEGV